MSNPTQQPNHQAISRIGLALGTAMLSCTAGLGAQQNLRWEMLTANNHLGSAIWHCTQNQELRLFSIFVSSPIPSLSRDIFALGSRHWRQVANIAEPVGAGHHNIAYDEQRQRLVVVDRDPNTFMEVTWEWDGTAWTQVVVGTAHVGLWTLAYDAGRGRVLRCALWPNWQIWQPDEFVTEEWDGAQWSLVQRGGVTPRTTFAVSYDRSRQRMVLFGGVLSPSNQPATDTWELTASGWQQVAQSGPVGRSGHLLAYDQQRQVTVMFGGRDPNSAMVVYRDTWEWDGQTWREATATGGLQAPSCATYDPRQQRVVAFGGFDFLAGYSNQAMAWDGQQWTARSEFSPQQTRNATFDPRQRSLVVGASLDPVSGPPQFGLWRWLNGQWDLRSWAIPPLHLVASDSSQHGLLAMQDYQPTASPILWQLQGNQWTQHAHPGPSPRNMYGAAYDRQRQRLVLFGGMTHPNNTMLDETWEWDPNNGWQQRMLQGPGARRLHAMTYDEHSHRVLLHGGLPLLGDTWSYDGTAWSQLASQGPPARFAASLVYDPSARRFLFSGGQSFQVQAFHDLWSFDGTDWTELPAPGRWVYHTVYHPGTNSIWSLENDTFLELVVGATAEPYGSGCGTPPLALRGDANHPPLLGATATALLDHLPGSLAWVALGLQRDRIGTNSLPLPLAAFGMPGCSLWNSADHLAIATTPTGTGTAQYSLTVPESPSLLSLAVYLQAWAPAAQANAAGIVLSNGLEWRFGR